MRIFTTLLIASVVSFLFAAVSEFRFDHTPYVASGAILYSIIAWQTWNHAKLRLPLAISMFVGWIFFGYAGPLVSTARHSHLLTTCPFDSCCGLSGITSGIAGSSILILGTWLLLVERGASSDPKPKLQITIRHMIWAISLGTVVFAGFVPGIQQKSATKNARERLLEDIDVISFRDAGRELISGNSLDERNQEWLDLTQLPDEIASTNPSHGFTAFGYLALFYGPTGNISLVVVQKGDQRSFGSKLLVDGLYYDEDPW